MREVVFIKKNTEKWQKIEKLFQRSADATPDALADSFIELTDDLAYARTFYPASQVESYLNGLASQAHRLIYVNRKEKSSRILNYWSKEFPILMFSMRKFMLYSFIFFAIGVFIGLLSSANDDRFVRVVLGDSYVNMTLENIQKKDPMAVYKQANEADMFLGITWNNITVMFRAFSLGIFFSFGTLYVLFSNGVMLGSFQHFFFEHGVLYESILSIWIHGTIEIFCIIVSGAAGLALGNSFLFPGTFSRVHSLREGASKGLKTAVGIAPFIVLAAFLEGFVTRHTETPDSIRWLIILASLLLIGWYFFWLPAKIVRKIEKQ